MIAVWEQLAGESIEDFELFQLYLQHRNLADVSREVGRNLGPLSAKNRWRARKEAYVKALHHEAMDAAMQESRDIGREHARVAVTLRELGEKGLLELLASGERPTYKEAIALVQAGVEIERLLAGQSTQHVSIDLSGVSDSDLDALEDKVERLVQPFVRH